MENGKEITRIMFVCHGNICRSPMAECIARTELLRHGIDPAGKRAVQLTAADYVKYDLFVGMDSANIRNMHRILGGDPQKKIRKLMEYTARGGDVADPWYSDRFDVAFSDISEGCAALLDAIFDKKPETVS